VAQPAKTAFFSFLRAFASVAVFGGLCPVPTFGGFLKMMLRR
jgi:hypothetical protein